MSAEKSPGPTLGENRISGSACFFVAPPSAAALPVAVVNPRQVRDFAKSTERLAKTDRLDAPVMAHFAEAVGLPMRPVRGAETQSLFALPGSRRQVMTMPVAGKNLLRRAVAEVRPRIQSRITWLEQELHDVDTELRRMIRRSPALREQDELLHNVPGVEEQVSLTLLANLPELATLDRNQIAALV